MDTLLRTRQPINSVNYASHGDGILPTSTTLSNASVVTTPKSYYRIQHGTYQQILSLLQGLQTSQTISPNVLPTTTPYHVEV